jgi:hypothetical protein
MRKRVFHTSRMKAGSDACLIHMITGRRTMLPFLLEIYRLSPPSSFGLLRNLPNGWKSDTVTANLVTSMP